MKRLIPLLFLATPAFAAEQKPPEMVLLPRDLVEQVHQWLLRPDATNAVMLYGSLQLCMADNPHDGALMRSGPDQCPAVTAAIQARADEITALQKKLDAVTKQPDAPKPQ